MVMIHEPSEPLYLGWLERQLGYEFSKRRLLAQALHPVEYKRLAWLGDAVLKLVLSDRLFQDLPPSATAGKLSLWRELLERRRSCTAYAEQLGLQWLVKSTPSAYSSRLAETFEAVLAAVYLDSGSTLGNVSSIVCGLCVPQTEGAAWGEMLETADRRRKAASRASRAGRQASRWGQRCQPTAVAAAGRADGGEMGVQTPQPGAAASQHGEPTVPASAGKAGSKGKTVRQASKSAEVAEKAASTAAAAAAAAGQAGKKRKREEGAGMAAKKSKAAAAVGKAAKENKTAVAAAAGKAVKKDKTEAVGGKAAKKDKTAGAAAGRVAKKSKMAGKAAGRVAKKSKTAAAGQASKKGVTVAAGKQETGKEAATAGKGAMRGKSAAKERKAAAAAGMADKKRKQYIGRALTRAV